MGRKRSVQVTTITSNDGGGGDVEGDHIEIDASVENDIQDFFPNRKITKRRKKITEEEGIPLEMEFRFRKRLRERIKRDDHFKAMSIKEQIEHLKREDAIYEVQRFEEPIRYRVVKSDKMSAMAKAMILQKLDHFESLHREENEYAKLGKWFKNFEKIPFERMIHFPVKREDGIEKVRAFMGECTRILDETIYGQGRAKRKILEIIAQRITNPGSISPVIALVGSAGVGKTTLIKNGVSRALGLPFSFTTLGGASDASYLDGHSYTYEGSTYGRVVEMLMEAKCMNPILFFDELDKVSTTEKGAEIQNLLIHLTDSTQNDTFHDKYLSGIDLDVSKCIFFFSLNDISLISPILRDRLTVVEFDNYGEKEKGHIARGHVIPEICRNMGLGSEEYVFREEVIRYVIEKCDGGQDDGVRGVKRAFERILMRLNYESYMPAEAQMIRVGEERPFQVEREHVDRVLQDMVTSKESSSKRGIEMMYV